VAFKKALEIRGEVKGLKSQWLLRDENDPDAGYAISQWESGEDMRAFWDSKKRRDAMAVLQPFFVNQFTITNCAIRVAVSH
jgi:heme-degrading monooxygenase HmoA